MVLRLPGDYQVNPEDPRAPSQALWDRMSPEQRAQVVAMLPSDFTLDALPPEGDAHTKASAGARFTLDGFFRRIGRKIYISSNLAVYYPGERCFAPDVIAVRDVEPHDRERWVVAAEAKGIDLAIEVLVSGNRAKDEVDNVARYARLGIHEYFLLDRPRRILRGYRLPEGEAPDAERLVYRPIVPQEGRYPSEILGLDLVLEGDRLRFMYGDAPVLEADELIARLGVALDEALSGKEDAERRAQALERELEQVRAENERLRRMNEPSG